MFALSARSHIIRFCKNGSLQAAKAAVAEDGEEDSGEGAHAVNASFDYLLSMAIYSLTWEKVQALEEEANLQVSPAAAKLYHSLFPGCGDSTLLLACIAAF